MKELLILVLMFFSIALFAQKGETVKYNESGDKIVIRTLDSGKETMYIKYDAEGTLSETGCYLNGVKHRSWTYFTKDKKPVAVANFNRGVREGKWLIWDSEGYLRYEIYYKNNRIKSAYELNREGLMVAEIHK